MIHLQTVLFAVSLVHVIVWVSLKPSCESPGLVVCPLPYTFLVFVGPSYPDVVQAFFLHSAQKMSHDGIRGDRGQMDTVTLIHAELLSIEPALLVGAPQVAVSSILLPISSTTCNARVQLSTIIG